MKKTIFKILQWLLFLIAGAVILAPVAYSSVVRISQSEKPEPLLIFMVIIMWFYILLINLAIWFFIISGIINYLS